RFNLQGEEGAARLFMGEVTRGRFGGGFLYTNQASVSLGLVVGIAALDGGEEVRLPELLDEFKRRPEVARLLAGGNLAEYSAHVVPEGGLDSMGPLYGHGILVAGDAAGLAMNIGVTVRGMEYALASGYYAAQAVLQARQAGDFSAASLARYEAMLRDSFVLKDFTSFREAPHVLDNPRLFQHYPELVTGILREVYAVPAGPKDRLFATVARRLDAGQLWQMARDAWRLRKI
ncbi:MAG: electron transfer flavoprotein, partial [Syntrophomonadaceae bacterium]|nr:electron transfer flavoprotein [Syntrophomonadaceae bacterium]